MKLEFIENIIGLSGNKLPIFCIQEHFLLRSNLRRLTNHFKNYAVLAKPATKDFNIQNKGRPKGGLVIIVPKLLRKSIKLVNSNSWRLQAIVVELNAKRLLIINCYFPTDKRNQDGVCPELEECLAEISNLIQTNNFTDLRILGDLNYEANRRTSHANMMSNFLAEKNMNSAWDFHAIDFTYVFESENGGTRRSIIDHFVGLKRDNESVLEAGLFTGLKIVRTMKLFTV